MGAASARHSPCPLLEEGSPTANLGRGNAPRDRERLNRAELAVTARSGREHQVNERFRRLRSISPKSASERAYVRLAMGGAAVWSGRRGSNPRPRPWQGRALPLSYTRIRVDGAVRAGNGQTYAKSGGRMQQGCDTQTRTIFFAGSGPDRAWRSKMAPRARQTGPFAVSSDPVARIRSRSARRQLRASARANSPRPAKAGGTD
jgi:hypothetical protein